MKHRVLFFLLFLFPFVSVQAENVLGSCRLIGYTNCDSSNSCNNLTLFELQDNHYIEVAAISPEAGLKLYFPANGSNFQRYSLASNHKRIAVQQVSVADPLPIENFVWIVVYDIDNGFEYVTGLSDSLLADGSIWSSDSNKLLFWDAWGHYMLNQYDFLTTEGGVLWLAPPLESVQAYQVAWSPSGDRIAVVGNEYPFPISEHGINDVTALYIVEPESAVYTPISHPKHDVSWGFQWLSDNRVAYMEHDNSDDGQVTEWRLKISTTMGEEVSTIKGGYTIMGKIFGDGDKLLLGTPLTKFQYRLLIFGPTTSELTTLIDLPIDDTSPFPRFNLSPDYHHIAYLDPAGDKLSVVNLETQAMAEFTTPLEGNVGWWTGDSKALIFFDYAHDAIQQYDVATETLTESAASELFPEYESLPLYPNWLCDGE